MKLSQCGILVAGVEFLPCPCHEESPEKEEQEEVEREKGGGNVCLLYG